MNKIKTIIRKEWAEVFKHRMVLFTVIFMPLILTAIPLGILYSTRGETAAMGDVSGELMVADIDAGARMDRVCAAALADDDSDASKRLHKVLVCHIPPGNPDNWHTISVDQHAVPAHLAHGDFLGSCEEALVTICWLPPGCDRWSARTIEVMPEEVDGYLAQGAILGPCPPCEEGAMPECADPWCCLGFYRKVLLISILIKDYISKKHLFRQVLFLLRCSYILLRVNSLAQSKFSCSE